MEQGTAALVVASDPGAGFPTSKYLARYAGEPLLGRVLRDVTAWPVDRTYVVLGAAADEILAVVDVGEATVIVDPEWEEGLASSLRVGLDTLTRDRVARCVLGHGDQVGVAPEDVAALLHEQESSRADIVVPKYRYARGWPLVLTQAVWPRLLGLEGAVDLLELLQVHTEGVIEVQFEHTAPNRVLDPRDLQSGRG